MQTLKRRRRARRRMRRLFLPLLLILLVILGLCQLLRNRDGGAARQPETRELSTQERENLSELPERLQDLYNSNPDARRFVLEYTEKKDADPVIDLSEYENCTQVPLLMQWDERWGYKPYAGYLFGLTGCGPTCLSMCAIYLTGNPDYSPEYVRTFAIENGYYVENNGSTWTLISEGGPMLGLDVTEIPLDEQRLLENLWVGNPVICIMGPGDFTDGGHFIVLTGADGEGNLTVNDPNSYRNSERSWTFDEIRDQIDNLWVLR